MADVFPAEFYVKKPSQPCPMYIVSVKRGQPVGASYQYDVNWVCNGKVCCSRILLDTTQELVTALQNDLRLPKDCVEQAGFAGGVDLHFSRPIGEPPKLKRKANQEVKILLQHYGNDGSTVWVSILPRSTQTWQRLWRRRMMFLSTPWVRGEFFSLTRTCARRWSLSAHRRGTSGTTNR